jgi:thiol:disulfide interchange protein
MHVSKPSARMIVAAIALAFVAYGMTADAGLAGKSIRWQTDYKKAQAAARKQKKIIMVDFYADW